MGGDERNVVPLGEQRDDLLKCQHKGGGHVHAVAAGNRDSRIGGTILSRQALQRSRRSPG